jgi:exopolyphosphatase/guanosine-5'-triphosphate,3'-diphosphate pyrophosphatase
MVRLAEGLDRSHAQTISGVDVFPRSDDYLVRVRAAGDAELELWAAIRHAAPFEKMLGRPIRFEVSKREYKERTSNAEQPDHAARVSRKAVRRGGHRRVRKDDAAGPAGEVA